MITNHSNQSNSTPDYFSYLMRLWCTQDGDGLVWCASLEEPLTREIHRFDDLHALLAFLMARTGQDMHDQAAPDVPPDV